MTVQLTPHCIMFMSNKSYIIESVSIYMAITFFRSVSLVVILTLSFNAFAKNKTVESIPVKIIRVIDGDTVVLSENISGTDRLRLEGIDTPETRTAKCDREARLGYEAKGYARAILEDKDVVIYTSGKTDKYRRLLGRIMVGNANYGQIMIEKGYAVRWTKEWAATPKEKRWC